MKVPWCDVCVFVRLSVFVLCVRACRLSVCLCVLCYVSCVFVWQEGAGWMSRVIVCNCVSMIVFISHKKRKYCDFCVVVHLKL